MKTATPKTEQTIRTVVASAPLDSCLAILVTYFHALPSTKEAWFDLFRRDRRDGAITHLCPEGLVVLVYNSKPDRTHVELIDIMESPLNLGSVLFGGVMCYVEVCLLFTKSAITEFKADKSRSISILWIPYLNGGRCCY
jgi:hypothetical protein